MQWLDAEKSGSLVVEAKGVELLMMTITSCAISMCKSCVGTKSA